MPADATTSSPPGERRPPPPVRCLTFHAGYGCRQTGVCCASNWSVPVEEDRHAGLRSALDAGRLLPVSGGPDAALESVPATPGAPPHRLGRSGGRCVFFDASSPSCRVHATLGHEALPLACRQFPRVSVRDPRGVSVTLSHYCPTAAAMLDDDVPFAIAIHPPGFPADGEYDGIDAARAMPPLLRPDMLMDWESWWTFEALSIEMLAAGTGEPRGPALAIGRLRAAVERLREWQPATGPLLSLVRSTMDAARTADVAPFALTPDERSLRLQEIVQATPPHLAHEHGGLAASGPARTTPGTTARFLAAHAFANWHIQLGQGLRTWLRSIEAAHALLQIGMDVGEADLWLRHLADVNRLARTWSRTE